MDKAEIKKLLKIYYDIPRMIDEEIGTIRHCQEQRGKISLPSINFSGMPGAKGLPGDRTAALALGDQSKLFDREIADCYRRIAVLQEQYTWCGIALSHLDRIDRRILELAYMGPQDPKLRARWNRKPLWKEIASAVEYSQSQTRARAACALSRLAALSDQQAIAGPASSAGWESGNCTGKKEPGISDTKAKSWEAQRKMPQKVRQYF